MRAVHKSNEMTYIFIKSYNLDTIRKWDTKYILTKRLLKPTYTNTHEISAKKHDLQDGTKKSESKTCRQCTKTTSAMHQYNIGYTSRPQCLLARHLHIYREGELGYSVNDIRNKGFAWLISKISSKTIHSILYNQGGKSSSFADLSSSLHVNNIYIIHGAMTFQDKGAVAL